MRLVDLIFTFGIGMIFGLAYMRYLWARSLGNRWSVLSRDDV